jgi:hypothetical protein
MLRLHYHVAASIDGFIAIHRSTSPRSIRTSTGTIQSIWPTARKRQTAPSSPSHFAELPT